MQPCTIHHALDSSTLDRMRHLSSLCALSFSSPSCGLFPKRSHWTEESPSSTRRSQNSGSGTQNIKIVYF
ncbi:Protein of unknown function [Pyronema omphalodes CBS 100304]|uniref:Uncharacterized protein n=1 Tax=Pyronema omphalodes (strain CBS 100304) TaxID=1076935 RepID=U4LJ30_PYROM|nr:Protein of unknown function [Pyronema omphalodes CBS 100304]